MGLGEDGKERSGGTNLMSIRHDKRQGRRAKKKTTDGDETGGDEDGEEEGEEEEATTVAAATMKRKTRPPKMPTTSKVPNITATKSSKAPQLIHCFIDSMFTM